MLDLRLAERVHVRRRQVVADVEGARHVAALPALVLHEQIVGGGLDCELRRQAAIRVALLDGLGSLNR